jgi:hypothetical protein
MTFFRTAYIQFPKGRRISLPGLGRSLRCARPASSASLTAAAADPDRRPQQRAGNSGAGAPSGAFGWEEVLGSAGGTLAAPRRLVYMAARAALLELTPPMSRLPTRPVGFIVPAQPITAPKPPSGPGWLHQARRAAYGSELNHASTSFLA